MKSTAMSSLMLVTAAVFGGCSEEPDNLILEGLAPPTEYRAPQQEIINTIEDEEAKPLRKVAAPRYKHVRPASRFREKNFAGDFARNHYQNVAFGQAVVKELLQFTGPTQEYRLPPWLPLDIKEIHTEFLHLVQRAPAKIRKDIFKDLEIFMVFKAAYDILSQEERLSLVRDWKDHYGTEAPETPEGNPFYPLFWLRTTPALWERGGQFWWWAAPALMKDANFEIDEAGPVRYLPPGSDLCFTS